jgi:hypothetical protein
VSFYSPSQQKGRPEHIPRAILLSDPLIQTDSKSEKASRLFESQRSDRIAAATTLWIWSARLRSRRSTSTGDLRPNGHPMDPIGGRASLDRRSEVGKLEDDHIYAADRRDKSRKGSLRAKCIWRNANAQSRDVLCDDIHREYFPPPLTPIVRPMADPFQFGVFPDVKGNGAPRALSGRRRILHNATCL